MVTKVKGSTFYTADNVGYANIQDYGARPDGTTICTAAIVLAFATGLPVFVPAGTFLTRAFSIPANGTLFGVGNASVLKQAVIGNAILVTINNGASIKDITIDGNKTNQVGTNLHGVQFSNSVASKASGINVINTNGDGINITGVSTNGVLLSNCTTTGYLGNGITVDSGSNVVMDSCIAYTSDVTASPGNGINISSNGTAVAKVAIMACRTSNNVGSGIVLKGNGSKNVTDVTVMGSISSNNSINGVYLLNADRCILSGVVSNTNTNDGFRLEGDVQNCRVAECVANSNVAFGFREVVSGSTPNFNGFIYETCTGNGNNTITKVGANSSVFLV